MNSMYSVEQVNIPPELGTILKQYTKAVIRDKPTDIYRYSANFFAVLSGSDAPFGEESFNRPAVSQASAAQTPSPTRAQAGHHEERDDAVDEEPVEMTEQEAVNTIFERFDDGNGRLNIASLGDLLEEVKVTLGLREQDLPALDELLAALTVENDTIQLAELQQTLLN
ncbi:hypothetical protein AGDE_11897 [Angomonas deanei]|nr:hypothetical protein AGDE_11897 [Angomonas deanei]|eukprot:EPY25311.1 hypothetical protein AGDE_11897 [Angomonas deanei]